MKHIALSCLILLSSFGAFCKKVDTARVLLNSKMLLTEYLGEFGTEEYYHKFIEYTPPVRFLKSTGFEDRFIFYEFEIKPTNAVATPINDSMMLLQEFFKLLYDGKVVFAFDIRSREIYRLAGFKNDDSPSFFQYLQNGFSYQLYNKKISCKEISHYYQIEGLDLKCLCKSKFKKVKCYPVLQQISTVAW
jgi:hypothetical protein